MFNLIYVRRLRVLNYDVIWKLKKEEGRLKKIYRIFRFWWNVGIKLRDVYRCDFRGK